MLSAQMNLQGLEHPGTKWGRPILLLGEPFCSDLKELYDAAHVLGGHVRDLV